MSGHDASINLRWLDTYRQVVELQSFSRAAERLGVSQPAVSQQMRALERFFGVRLVSASPRAVLTTAAGRRVYEMAARVGDDLRRLRRELAEAEKYPAGLVRIACGPTALVHYIPRLLKALWLEQPDIAVRTMTLVGAPMTSAVLDGAADVAIQSGAHLDPRLHAAPCMDDHIILVCAPEHSLAAAEFVDAKELEAVRLGAISPRSETGALVQNWLEEQAVTPRQMVEFGATEAVRAAALSGLLAGFVSQYSVADDLSAGRLVQVRIDGPAAARHMYALHQPEPGEAVQRLLDVVRTLHQAGAGLPS